MTPELKHALAIGERCNEQLEELRHRALQGDLASALVLVDLTFQATRFLRDLWFEHAIYNPFGSNDCASEIEVRREALAYWLGEREQLPALISLDGTIDPDGATMLCGIRAGPFKSRRRKPTDAKTLIEAIVLPAFQKIRLQPKRPSAIEGRIWALPPLSQQSQSEWSSTIVEWLRNRCGDKLRTPSSWLYRLARPENGLKAEQRKRRATLNRNRAKWRRDGGGEMSPVAATKAEYEAKQIAKMRVTDAQVNNGLKTVISAYLKRNLST